MINSAPTPDDPVQSWISLPRRIYLDTSTLQALYDHGDVTFEGEPFVPVGQAAKVKGLGEELAALRKIFLVNELARFEFVITEANLQEIANRGEPRYTQWVYDVLDTWLIQLEGEKPPVPSSTTRSMSANEVNGRRDHSRVAATLAVDLAGLNPGDVNAVRNADPVTDGRVCPNVVTRPVWIANDQFPEIQLPLHSIAVTVANGVVILTEYRPAVTQATWRRRCRRPRVFTLSFRSWVLRVSERGRVSLT
jgi:hypothetical protein